MAVGAKDSEMIKLKYFLKDLGLYKVTKGVHIRNTGSGLLRVHYAEEPQCFGEKWDSE